MKISGSSFRQGNYMKPLRTGKISETSLRESSKLPEVSNPLLELKNLKERDYSEDLINFIKGLKGEIPYTTKEELIDWINFQVVDFYPSGTTSAHVYKTQYVLIKQLIKKAKELNYDLTRGIWSLLMLSDIEINQVNERDVLTRAKIVLKYIDSLRKENLDPKLKNDERRVRIRNQVISDIFHLSYYYDPIYEEYKIKPNYPPHLDKNKEKLITFLLTNYLSRDRVTIDGKRYKVSTDSLEGIAQMINSLDIAEDIPLTDKQVELYKFLAKELIKYNKKPSYHWIDGISWALNARYINDRDLKRLKKLLKEYMYSDKLSYERRSKLKKEIEEIVSIPPVIRKAKALFKGAVDISLLLAFSIIGGVFKSLEPILKSKKIKAL